MVRFWWRYVPAFLLATMLVVALTACANMDTGGPATGGFSAEIVANQIEVSADPRGALRWERDSYEGTAGDVTFVVKNPSTLAHNFVVEGDGLKAASKTIGAKKSQNLTLKGLVPGENLIVCTLPGHREAGMVATLVLK